LTREEARKRLFGALELFRIEGVKSNIPALKGVLIDPRFVDGSYDTSLLSTMGATPKQPNATESYFVNPNGNQDKELAAAIGVSLLLSMNGHSGLGNGFQGKGAGSWKLYGRKEQMLSRTPGSRGWR